MHSNWGRRKIALANVFFWDSPVLKFFSSNFPPSHPKPDEKRLCLVALKRAILLGGLRWGVFICVLGGWFGGKWALGL